MQNQTQALFFKRENKQLVKTNEELGTYKLKPVFHGLGNNYLIVHYENAITKQWQKAKFQGKLWNEAKEVLSVNLNITDWPVMNDDNVL
jgi:hypothetical protein